jgi:NTE family protein
MTLRRPLGLFLSGGGALGCWQAAALKRLVEGGLSFDAVMGVSIGALTGACYAFGMLEAWLRRWRRADWSVLHWSPRLYPFSMFSDETFAVPFDGHPEEELRSKLRCPLTVVSLSRGEDRRVYAHYTPRGLWDAPIRAHLSASCAVPGVFPPVQVEYRGRLVTLVDGGVPLGPDLDFYPLENCADIVVVETTPPPPAGAWSRRVESFERMFDPLARVLSSIVGRPKAPRIFRLFPSRPLSSRFVLRPSAIHEGLLQGEWDASSFQRRPLEYIVDNAARPA